MITVTQQPGYFSIDDTVTGTDHTNTQTLTLRTTSEPEPYVYINVQNDDGRTESATISVTLHDARALCGFLHEWLADYEG